jgi:hypothetical protein
MTKHSSIHMGQFTSWTATTVTYGLCYVVAPPAGCLVKSPNGIGAGLAGAAAGISMIEITGSIDLPR